MNTKNNKLTEIILKIFCALGIGIAIFNFAYNRSLWLDEAMLALNIVKRPMLGLLSPLDMNQVAPIGFLLVEKAITLAFGNQDWVLRIFPLFSFLLSIPLFYHLSYRITGSKLISLVSCSVFSLLLNLIRYATEVKQYSTDVLAAITIILSTLVFLESKDKKWILWYALIGVFSIWFSNVAVVLLFTAGLYVLYGYLKKKEGSIYKTVVPIAAWVVSFAVYYIFFIHNHPAKKMMSDYWSNTFIPQNIFSADFYMSVWDKLQLVTGGLLVLNRFWPVAMFFVLAGIISAVKASEKVFLILFPVVLHFMLAYFKLYPFELRLILYLTPFIVLFYVMGMVFVYSLFKKAFITTPFFLLLFHTFFCFYILITNIPIEKEEIKKGLEYVNKKIAPSDKIYVYYAARPAFEFYRDKYYNINKIDKIIFGKSNRKNWDYYNKEIVDITGTIWVVFSHIYYVKNKDGLKEDAYITRQLAAVGYQIIDKKESKGVIIYKVLK